MTKHIQNATWPEGCGQRNEKTRKRENQKTRKRERFWPFSRFRVSRCSHLRASLIASLIDCNMLLDANTAFLLSPFSGLRVFAVFGFSPFSRFRVFAVFAVFAFSGFRRFRRFLVFAVFVFDRLIPPVFAFLCFHMFSPGVFVLRNALLRYIPYTCPKL